MNRNALPLGMKARIFGATQATRSPTRRSVAFDASLVLLTAGAVALNLFLAIGGTQVGRRPLGLVALAAIGRGTVALASTWAALGRGRSMFGRTLFGLATSAVATPLAAACITWLAADAAADGGVNPWPCFAAATLLGSVPLVAFALLHRRSDLSHPIATGAALGAAAGAWGDLLTSLHCPASEIAHLLLFHLGPTLLLVAIGSVLGALVIRRGSASDGFERSRSMTHRFTNGG